MDARTTMIIAKGKFVTTDVTDCIYHKENHKWEIVFKSGRSFFYNQQNVLCLKNPRNLDPKNIKCAVRERYLIILKRSYRFRQKMRNIGTLCFLQAMSMTIAAENFKLKGRFSKIAVQKKCSTISRKRQMQSAFGQKTKRQS